MSELLKPAEAAKVLGIHINTLAHWRQLGIGPAYFQEERVVRYPLDRLTEYVNSKLVRGGQQGERHA